MKKIEVIKDIQSKPEKIISAFRDLTLKNRLEL